MQFQFVLTDNCTSLIKYILTEHSKQRIVKHEKKLHKITQLQLTKKHPTRQAFSVRNYTEVIFCSPGLFILFVGKKNLFI